MTRLRAASVVSFRTASSPRETAAVSTSRRRTVAPPIAADCAMPEPMRPAPTSAQRAARVAAARVQDLIERARQTDQARQALRATRARKKTERDLRQTDAHARRVGGDAPVAGERELVTTTERAPVDRGDGGEGERREVAKDALDLAAPLAELGGGRPVRQHREVRAGDELVRLRADDDETAGPRLARVGDRAPERGDERRVDGVDVVRRAVHDDARDLAVLETRAGGRDGRDVYVERRDARRYVCRAGHARSSSTIAAPLPPAAHALARPNCTPRRRISFASVVTSRAPVAPKGCPSAIEPPMTFTTSSSTRPAPFCSSTWKVERTCAANASCISMRLISESVSPARFSAMGIAYAGAMSSWSAGSTAAYAYERIATRTVRPSARARAPDMRSTVAAPSVSGLALPAVIVPCARSNTGRSVASFSSVVSRRMCPSCVTE